MTKRRKRNWLMIRRILWMGLWLCFMACARESGIVVKIHSALPIPERMNILGITVTNNEEGEAYLVLAQDRRDFSGQSTRYALTLHLSNESALPTLKVIVEGFLNESLVAYGAIVITDATREFIEVTLTLGEPDAGEDSGADAGGEAGEDVSTDDADSSEDPGPDTSNCEINCLIGEQLCSSDYFSLLTCLQGEECLYYESEPCGPDALGQEQPCYEAISGVQCCENACYKADIRCTPGGTEKIASFDRCERDNGGCLSYGEPNPCLNPFECYYPLNLCATGELPSDPIEHLNGIQIAAMNHQFLILWEENVPALNQSYDIWGKIVNSNGAPIGSKFIINIYTTNNQINVKVQKMNDVRWVVLWESSGQDGSDLGIYGRILNSQGTPIGSESEFGVNVYTTSSQKGVDIGILNDNRFMLVWRSYKQDGDDTGLYGRGFDSRGIAVTTEFQVNEYTTDSQFYPKIGVLNENRFVVVWVSEKQDGDSYGIYGKIMNSQGKSISSEFLVNDHTTGSQDYPQLIVFYENRFGVIWFSAGLFGGTSVFLARFFDGQGSTLTPEIVINNYTTSDIKQFIFQRINENQFVTAWMYEREDGIAVISGKVLDSLGRFLTSEFQIGTSVSSVDLYDMNMLDENRIFVLWKGYSTQTGREDLIGKTYFLNRAIQPDSFSININTHDIGLKPAMEILDDRIFVIWDKSNDMFGRIIKQDDSN